jgi:hypothetical protein
MAKSDCNESISMAIIDGYREKRKNIIISFPAKLRKWPQIWKWWVPRNLPISTDLPTATVFFSRVLLYRSVNTSNVQLSMQVHNAPADHVNKD